MLIHYIRHKVIICVFDKSHTSYIIHLIYIYYTSGLVWYYYDLRAAQTPQDFNHPPGLLLPASLRFSFANLDRRARGSQSFFLICFNTSRCVFCRNSPKKGEQRFFVFLLKSVCKHVSYSIIFIEAAVNISPLFKVVESYFIKLVWTFHLYFFQSGVMFLFPTRL